MLMPLLRHFHMAKFSIQLCQQLALVLCIVCACALNVNFNVHTEINIDANALRVISAHSILVFFIHFVFPFSNQLMLNRM